MSLPEPDGLGAFLAPGPSSFTDLVTATAPHLLPGRAEPPAAADPTIGGQPVHHGTTIVAMVFADGVLIAADRRATAGNMIGQRDVDKIHVTDSHSAIGVAGSAGAATQLARLYTVDLEHYEKTEGVSLSLDGKANKLAGMVAQNLPAALQGFVVLPLFVGYDPDRPPATAGRIVTYDATGGRYDELLGHHAVGSGSVFARGALKKRHDPTADLAATVRTAVEALYDAADDDTATGGPDLVRGIYPMVVSITADGAVRHPAEEIAEVAVAVVAGRTTRPGG